MDKKELENKIEAMLFATGRDISVTEFMDVLEATKEEVEEAIENLKNIYENRGITLLEVKDSYQLVSNKKYYDDVIKLYDSSRKRGITPACMEVLAIIAYNPKITKAQVERIRGVNSDAAVNRLVEFGMVEECGRLKAPGRPVLYRTTKEFLIEFGIKDINEMPDFENLKINKEEQIEMEDFDN